MSTLATTHDVLLLDLDGTVWESGIALDHAVETIKASGMAAVYVTNNASRSPEVVADMLRAIGLDAVAGDVLTSAQAGVHLAKQLYPDARTALVLGTDSFRKLAHNAGFTVVSSADEHPDVVLHGHNPETGWAQLTEAALAIRAGAGYVASNLDTSLPTPRGLCVGNGSMVAAVTSATGVTPASAGKPGPAMFRQAATATGAQAPLGVGDRLDTDIAGGIAAGMPTFHVLTGVSGPKALIEAIPEHRPTYIADNLRGLFAEVETLTPGPQGGFVATMAQDKVIELGGGTDQSTGTEALLTVLELAWGYNTTEVRATSKHAERAMEQWW